MSGAHTYDSRLEPPVIKRRHFGKVEVPAVHWLGMTSCIGDGAPLNAAACAADPAPAIITAFASAQTTRRCQSAIGGPIDIGRIDASGRRWLQNKAQMAASPPGGLTGPSLNFG